MPHSKMSLRAVQRSERDEMRGLGMSHRQIAVEFVRRYQLRARAAWRHAHGWSLTAAAEQISAYGASAGLSPDGATVAMTSSHLCEYENWPGEPPKPAGRRPTPYLLSLLASVYGCTVHDLLDLADYQHLPAAELLVIGKLPAGEERPGDRARIPDTSGVPARALKAEASGTAFPAPSAARLAHGLGTGGIPAFARGSDELDRLSQRALVQMAAHESSAHAEWAEGCNVGESTLEQLDADVRRIAADYVHVPPLPMFAEMLRVRNRVYGLLAGRQKPADTARLHLLAGALCGLLANASTDLGYRDAAAEQARAAWAYGDIIGHNGLRAWTRGMQALIEYWSGRPQHAVRLAESAGKYADSATSQVRLLAIQARAWSLIGDAREVNRCLAAVPGARDAVAGSDFLHDEVGGVFGFDDSKQHCYAAAAYTHVGQADAALAAASRAVELYATGAVAQRSYGAESLARADMAMACLLKKRLDGVAESLAPVLAIPAELRIAQLADRLSLVRQRLASEELGNARQARALHEQIGTFVSATLTQQLEGPGQAR